jgi:hypothetical protein
MKLAKARKTESTICFNAKLLGSRLSLPKNASAKFPKRGVTMIEGTINAFPFRAALEADDKGSHWLTCTKAMQDASGIKVLEKVIVEITRVGHEPETRVPMDLRKALKATPHALASWADITPMARRDWIFSISSAKQSETRKRRIEKACDMLASGKRRLCCFPGIKWVMKENEKSCGMWLPLPTSKN